MYSFKDIFKDIFSSWQIKLPVVQVTKLSLIDFSSVFSHIQSILSEKQFQVGVSVPAVYRSLTICLTRPSSFSWGVHCLNWWLVIWTCPHFFSGSTPLISSTTWNQATSRIPLMTAVVSCITRVKNETLRSTTTVKLAWSSSATLVHLGSWTPVVAPDSQAWDGLFAPWPAYLILPMPLQITNPLICANLCF